MINKSVVDESHLIEYNPDPKSSRAPKPPDSLNYLEESFFIFTIEPYASPFYLPLSFHGFQVPSLVNSLKNYTIPFQL